MVNTISLRSIGYLLTAPLVGMLGAFGQVGSLDPTFMVGTGFEGTEQYVGVEVVVQQPDGGLLVGGSFATFNGVPRNGIARLNSDGTLDPSFDPGAGITGGIFFGYVSAMALQPDGKIVVGGDFTVVDDVPRNFIARLHSDGSLDTSFDPASGFNSAVLALAVRPDGRIIVGGDFQTFNGVSRQYIAQLNADGSLDMSFDPGTGFPTAGSSEVYDLALQPDGRVVVGGAFFSYNGTPVQHITRLEPNGALDPSFVGFADERVWALRSQPDGKLLVGGQFLQVNGVPRAGLARLLPDGSLDPAFDPGTGFVGGPVFALALSPDGRIVASGRFLQVDGTSRPRIARLEANGQLDLAFDPGTGFNDPVGQGVPAVQVQSDGRVVAGGYYTTINGSSANRIARLLGDCLPGVPCDDGDAGTLNDAFDANCVCLGQSVDCNGVPGGSAFPGTPCNDCDPTTINDVYDANCVCAGVAIGGVAIQAGGLDPTFDPGDGFNDGTGRMALQPDGKVIVSGWFTAFDGTTRNRIARINVDGSLDVGYAPGSGFDGSRTTDLALQPDGKVFVSGGFSQYNGVSRNAIARLNADGALDATFNPGTGFGPDGFTTALALQPNGQLLVSGYFYSFNGAPAVDLVRLNAGGTLDPSFDVGLGFDYDPLFETDEPEELLLQPDGSVLVVGGFNWYDGLSPFVGDICRGIARLGPLGHFDNTFQHGSDWWDETEGFNATPKAMALMEDGRIYVGGYFTAYFGVERNRIIRLNADGTLDPTFDPGEGFNGEVLALAIQPDGSILVGGGFTAFQGVTRPRIARLNPDGSLDHSFQPCDGFNGAVRDLALQPDGRVLVTGEFTSFNGVARNRIARLFTVTGGCLPTQLTTTADPVISCGAVNLKLDGTSTIAATDVPGANKYQFRFTNIPGQPNYARNIAWPTRSFTLTKWYTNPLKAGRTYNVVVRASFDDGATWCDWGPSCTVKVDWFPLAPAMVRGMEEGLSTAPELLLFPNPTNGDQLRITMHGADPLQTTATLDLVDLFGKRVMTATLPLQDGGMDTVLPMIGELSIGMYIVTITAGGHVFNERLVIAR
jgi:uncharacterized delta-60 repeat protein